MIIPIASHSATGGSIGGALKVVEAFNIMEILKFKCNRNLNCMSRLRKKRKFKTKLLYSRSLRAMCGLRIKLLINLYHRGTPQSFSRGVLRRFRNLNLW